MLLGMAAQLLGLKLVAEALRSRAGNAQGAAHCWLHQLALIAWV